MTGTPQMLKEENYGTEYRDILLSVRTIWVGTLRDYPATDPEQSLSFQQRLEIVNCWTRLPLYYRAHKMQKGELPQQCWVLRWMLDHLLVFIQIHLPIQTALTLIAETLWEVGQSNFSKDVRLLWNHQHILYSLYFTEIFRFPWEFKKLGFLFSCT